MAQAYTSSGSAYTDMTAWAAYKKLITWQDMDKLAENDDKAEVHLDGVGTGTPGATNPHGLTGTDIGVSGTPPANSVGQGELKSSTGIVSRTGGPGYPLTLPGGEYGFYPQVRMNSTATTDWQAQILGMDYGGSSSDSFVGWTSYVTVISLYNVLGGIIYAQQRYVTASGKDPWLWILRDSNKKEIIDVWFAEDHPSYGQGFDEDQLPHPWIGFAMKPESIPNNIEIILVELNQTRQLFKAQFKDVVVEKKKNGKKIKIEYKNKLVRPVPEMVNEDYEVDMSKSYKYKPRDIADYFGNHWDVETIPDYVKVRKLKKK